MKTSDFYFVATFDQEVGCTMVYITDKQYFDEEGCASDEEINMEKLLPEYFSYEMEGTYSADDSVDNVRIDLLSRGFLENEKFSELVKG